MPSLDATNTNFEFGKGRVITEGDDIAIIATGETVQPALKAANKLKKEYNLNATVVSMHTIKPLDTDLLAKLASRCAAIITVEEHSVYGGLGEACASFLLENDYHIKFKIIGFPDEYTVTGSQKQIFDHYGISENGITDVALKLLSKQVGS